MDALLATAAAGSAVVISSHDDRITHRADRLLRLRHGVVSSETTSARRAAAAVIDATGRLQLPPEMLDLFPDRRVVVETDGDEVRLRRPVDDA
jgi:putative ABC transport system ATP-binding protein